MSERREPKKFDDKPKTIAKAVKDLLLPQAIIIVISALVSFHSTTLCETFLDFLVCFFMYVSAFNLFMCVFGVALVVFSLFKRERITLLDIFSIFISFLIGIPTIISII